MTLPESATERVLRECGCPPYVIRCAHPISGALLWLTRSDLERVEAARRGLPVEVACPECGALPTPGKGTDKPWWGVYGGQPEEPRCLCRMALTVYPGTPEHELYVNEAFRPYDDYDEALAAFHAAELELLRGGA